MTSHAGIGRSLHSTVRQLVEVVTFAEAMGIVRRWGNRRFRVPMKVGADDPLALTVGLDTARRLVAAYGGQVFDLPTERHALRAMRDEAIWKARMVDKRSLASVAMDFGLTRQWVSLLVKRMRHTHPERPTPAHDEAAVPTSRITTAARPHNSRRRP